MVPALLFVFVLAADPVAEAQALADRDGIAAFDAIFAAAVAEQNHRAQSKMLGILATFGAEAVPRAVALITTANPPARWRECAFMTLQQITRVDSAIPALVPLLDHKNRSIQRVVRDGLKREAAIPALFAVLKDTKLRNHARKILRTFGGKLKPYLKRDPDPAMRVQLVPLYVAAGELEELAKWVRDPDVRVRKQVVAEFGRHDAKVALPVLTAALDDKDVRQAALTALARLGKPAHAVFRKELAAKDVQRRQAAAKALADGGEAALSLLVPLLEDEAVDVQAAALSSLEALGETAASAAPAVAKLIHEKRLHGFVVDALGAMGPEALPSVLDLVPLLPPHTSYAILRTWGSRRATRALARLLGADKSAARRRAAAWALGRLGRAKAVPALIEALDDKDTLVVSQAIWALGQLGSKAKDAIPALRKKEKDAAHRSMARDALKRIEG